MALFIAVGGGMAKKLVLENVSVYKRIFVKILERYCQRKVGIV